MQTRALRSVGWLALVVLAFFLGYWVSITRHSAHPSPTNQGPSQPDSLNPATRAGLENELAAARNQVYESTLAQISALRRSRQPGQRTKTIERIGFLNQVRGNLPEHLSEAAAALTLPDISFSPSEASPSNALPTAIDPTFRHSLFLRAKGKLFQRVESSAPLGNIQESELEHPANAAAVDLIPLAQLTNHFAAVRYANGDILHWNLELAAVTARFTNVPPQAVLECSANGETLILVRPGDHTAEWRRLDRTKPKTGTLSFPGIRAAVPSPDGTECLIHHSQSSEIQVVQLDDGTSRGSLPTIAHPIFSRWSDDGRWLVTVSESQFVQLWDAQSLRLQSAWTLTESGLSEIQFIPGKPILMTLTGSGQWTLWDILTARPSLQTTVPGHRLQVDTLAKRAWIWGHAGNRLRLANLWLNSYRTELVSSLPIERPVWSPGDRAAAFSPDERWIAIAGPGGVRFWECSTRQLAFEIQATNGFQVYWHTNQNQFRSATEFGAQTWDVRQVDKSLTLESPRFLDRHTNACGEAAHSIDGAIRAYRYQDKIVVQSPGRKTLEIRMTDVPVKLCLSPDGQQLAVSVARGGCQVYDTGSGRATWTQPNQLPAEPIFSTDGLWLVLGTKEACTFYDRVQFQPARVINRREILNVPGAMAFSRDGHWFAYQDTLAEIAIVHTATRKGVLRLELSSPWPLTGLQFSPSKKQLIALSTQQISTLWNLDQLQTTLTSLGFADRLGFEGQ